MNILILTKIKIYDYCELKKINLQGKIVQAKADNINKHKEAESIGIPISQLEHRIFRARSTKGSVQFKQVIIIVNCCYILLLFII